MEPTLNLLIIDLAGSCLEEGDVDVLVNLDFATTQERKSYIENFAEERDLTGSELLDNGYVVVTDEWPR